MQLKAVDKFKYEKGKELDKKVDWAEALELWVQEGLAEKFAQHYTESIRFSTLYKKIRNGNGEKNSEKKS